MTNIGRAYIVKHFNFCINYRLRIHLRKTRIHNIRRKRLDWKSLLNKNWIIRGIFINMKWNFWHFGESFVQYIFHVTIVSLFDLHSWNKIVSVPTRGTSKSAPHIINIGEILDFFFFFFNNVNPVQSIYIS